MSLALVALGAVLIAVIVLSHHELFRDELGVASRLSSLVDRIVGRDADVDATPREPRTTPLEHGLFFGGLVLGGLLAALATHTFGFRPGVASEQFSAIFAGRIDAATALFVGGLFVGAGLRVAAPAFGGHGLLGLSRFDRSTAIGTAVFFAVAIAVSFLFEAAS